MYCHVNSCKIPLCDCSLHSPKPYRPLTILLLDIWQRYYDRRPYDTIILNRQTYERDMFRLLDQNDFNVLLQFLTERKGQIKNFELTSMPILDEYMDSLITAVKHFISVNLCFVHLTPRAIQNLSEGDCNISTLRLTGNIFNMEHAKNLRKFLLKTKTLQYLDIGYCRLNHQTLAVVADGVIHCQNLKGIDLSRTVTCYPYHRHDMAKIGEIFAIVLWRNQQIQEVHFKHCDLDGHDIENICEYIAQPITLTYLDLASNNIGAHGTLKLFKALEHSYHVMGLDISDNSIGEHGGEVIAHYLPYTKLRYLDIARNKIPAKMMKAILKSVKKPSQIQILNVVGNEFDYDGGAILRRQLDAHVLLLETTDCTVTYDEDEDGFRVIPNYKDLAQKNSPHNRVVPFYRKLDLFGPYKRTGMQNQTTNLNENIIK